MSTTVQSTLTDQTIAKDMLITAKTAVKELAVAITESASPQVRTFLKQEFNNAVAFQESLYGYMQSKGLYNAYNVKQQIQTDIQNSTAALNL